jgi:hypothetical protein
MASWEMGNASKLAGFHHIWLNVQSLSFLRKPMAMESFACDQTIQGACIVLARMNNPSLRIRQARRTFNHNR